MLPHTKGGKLINNTRLYLLSCFVYKVSYFRYLINYNITAALAVDREFVHIFLVAAASFRRLWGVLVSSAVDFGVHLASFGLPLGFFGGHWAALGRLLDLGDNRTSISKQMWAKCHAYAHDLASGNSVTAVVSGVSNCAPEPTFLTRRGLG